MNTISLLQADIENRGIVLDPRTKLLLLITMAVFVLGGVLSGSVVYLSPIICTFPFILLISGKKYSSAAVYAAVYIVSFFAGRYLMPLTTGVLNFLILGCTGILTKLLPSLMMGVYVMSTTTVSEFSAAMHRMHISEKLIIPMSVMFRFFPTVIDEFSSINAAMKMRGISLGGKKASKIIEYRLIPLMNCSVKIGEELSAAALTRGLGGKVKRTDVCKIGFHFADFIVFALCAVPFVCLILQLCGVIQ